MQYILPQQRLVLAVILAGSIILSSCQKMSEVRTNRSAGINGSFEEVADGLPVNWLMYTPNTVPSSDFKIELDETVFQDGTQSLKFDVKACESTGGWHSPGFTNEFSEGGPFNGPSTYRLSFYTKNNGSAYKISAGGVKPYGVEMKDLVVEATDSEDWIYHEFEVHVPADMHLRMQLNILQPGTFWIDNVQLQQVAE